MILGVLDPTQSRDVLERGVRRGLKHLARPCVRGVSVIAHDQVVLGVTPSGRPTQDLFLWPYTNASQTLAAVACGALYNTGEIRHRLGAESSWHPSSLSEALVGLYEQEPQSFLTHVNGKVAVALWDAPRRRLVLGRDRFGIEPLFYARDGSQLVFSSSLRALLSTGWVATQMDHEAILQYLLYGYNPSASTLIQGVSKLPAGHVLSVDGETAELVCRPYWFLSFAETEMKTEDAYREDVLSLMEEAVRIRLEPGEAPGIFLSGGTDSSAMVSLTSNLRAEAFPTFSFRCEGVSYDESHYARFVAQQFGTTHTETAYQPEHMLLMSDIATHMDEPFCDIGIEIATYLLGQVAQGRVSYVLSGEGGDELFGGHPVYTADKVASLIDWLPRPIVTPITGLFQHLPDSDHKKNLQVKLKRFTYSLSFPPELLSHRWRVYYTPAELQALCTDDFFASCDLSRIYDDMIRRNRESDGQDILSRSLHSDYATLVDFYLRRLELLRVFGIESRLPLLDHRLVAYAARIPSRLKLRGFSNSKYLYKKILRSHLPREILYDRPKLGHSVPMKNWMRDDDGASAFCEGVLRDPAFHGLGFFRAGAIEQLLAEHRRKTHNHSHRLWSLVVLALWLQSLEGHGGRP